MRYVLTFFAGAVIGAIALTVCRKPPAVQAEYIEYTIMDHVDIENSDGDAVMLPRANKIYLKRSDTER